MDSKAEKVSLLLLLFFFFFFGGGGGGVGDAEEKGSKCERRGREGWRARGAGGVWVWGERDGGRPGVVNIYYILVRRTMEVSNDATGRNILRAWRGFDGGFRAYSMLLRERLGGGGGVGE